METKLVNELNKNVALDLLNAARIGLKDVGIKTPVFYDSKKSVEDAAAQDIRVETISSEDLTLFGVFVGETFAFGQVYTKDSNPGSTGYMPLPDAKTYDFQEYLEFKSDI